MSVFSALCGGILSFGKSYSIVLFSVMLFKRFDGSIYRNLKELCANRRGLLSASASLYVKHAHLALNFAKVADGFDPRLTSGMI